MVADVRFDAYEVTEYGSRNYGVVLVDTRTGARFQTNSVVCGRQAHYQVTRGGQRPMRFLGVSTMRAGRMVVTSFPHECAISDPLHVHTHRMALPVV